MTETMGPSLVRVSLGSAILLRLISGKMDAKPSTIYLLSYHTAKCSADCGFCSQARTSKSRSDLLSRVMWPEFPVEEVVKRLKASGGAGIERVCIQVMNYPTALSETVSLVRRLHSEADIPISVSCQPLGLEQIKQLAESGVDRIGIPLDAPTKKLFERVKGKPYVWERQIKALKDAVKIMDRGRVSTHLIVGLGEKDKDVLRMVQWLVGIDVYPSLFAFTPIAGTRMEDQPQPSIERYRRIQLAHYLITNAKGRFEDMQFDRRGGLVGFGVDDVFLRKVINIGTAFMTSGCPGCNRPYYNERPGGPLFNYPRRPSGKELAEVEEQIMAGGRSG